MKQLSDKELLKWAIAYIKKYETDINNNYGSIEKYYKLDTPKIPNMGGVKGYFLIADLTEKVNKICADIKKAHTESKQHYTMMAINDEKVTFNLEPLLSHKNDKNEIVIIDDYTLQTYICRIFIHSKGG